MHEIDVEEAAFAAHELYQSLVSHLIGQNWDMGKIADSFHQKRTQAIFDFFVSPLEMSLEHRVRIGKVVIENIKSHLNYEHSMAVGDKKKQKQGEIAAMFHPQGLTQRLHIHAEQVLGLLRPVYNLAEEDSPNDTLSIDLKTTITTKTKSGMQ